MKEFYKIEELLNTGKISRRDFLGKASALGLTATLLPLLKHKLSYASVPKKGGRLRIGASMCSITDSLDPANVDKFQPGVVSWQLRNCLVEIDHDSKPVPELAESWDSSPDAKTWIFKLRKGVEFHNGKTMDVEDVIYSIDYHRGDKSKSGAKVIVDQIKEIKADGKYTVVFTLKDGNADFPYLMSDYHLQIVPNGTKYFDEGIGTGPYSLVNWEPGISAKTKRNPNYFKEGLPYFDEVESICIMDFTARTNALVTGQIDVLHNPDLKFVDLLGQKPGFQIVETTGLQHHSLPMLTDIPPYNNNDARLALKYAIDREHYVKMILRGHGMVGNDHPISPANQYYASELPQRKYDPDKAKYHMKKAGLSDQTFKLYVAPNAVFSGASDAAILLKEHAKKAGINIEVIRTPDDGYWSEVWMKRPWCFTFWFGRPTEDWMLSTVYAADAKWNDTHWKHERFNILLKEARSELDEIKRKEMYYEMQKIVRNEGGAIIPAFVNYVIAASSKLKFDKVASNMPFDGMKLPERWWFA